MATIYLSSVDGNDSDNGSTWALAKATMVAAVNAAGAGGTVYVDNAHAESTGAAKNITGGTAGNPVTVLCVVRGADVTPPVALATTATVTTTGNFIITIGLNTSNLIIYGISFICAAGSSTNNGIQVGATNSAGNITLINCKLTNATTNASTNMNLGFPGTLNGFQVRLVNTTVKFGAVGHSIRCNGKVIWENTPSAVDTNGSVPTTLFTGATSRPGASAVCRGVDFSGLGANNLLDLSSGEPLNYVFENCKLGSSPVVNTVVGEGAVAATFYNCDSADTNYKFRKNVYQGSILDAETIVRSGGASDGTTTVSRKMVTLASGSGPTFYTPLESDWTTFWNESLSAVTVSAAVITDNVTLTDADAWIEVEYLGTSGYPLSVFASDRAADILATPANQTTDTTSIWTTTGLGSPVQQTLSVTVTPVKKGLCRARVLLAKPSTTMYYDPKLDIA